MADNLKPLAAELGCDVVESGMAWTLSKPAFTSVIVGSSRDEQIVKNAEASEIALPPELLDELDLL